jgi:hypothetical protein
VLPATLLQVATPASPDEELRMSVGKTVTLAVVPVNVGVKVRSSVPPEVDLQVPSLRVTPTVMVEGSGAVPSCGSMTNGIPLFAVHVALPMKICGVPDVADVADVLVMVMA